MLNNKSILITGGTGSFGNAVLHRFLNTNIKEIRIFSRDEKKQHDMRLKYNNNKLKFIIGDVRDYNSINIAMQGVDFVFHAAALKQVPSCEFYPLEAVKTNILGTENVLNAAINNPMTSHFAISSRKSTKAYLNIRLKIFSVLFSSCFVFSLTGSVFSEESTTT